MHEPERPTTDSRPELLSIIPFGTNEHDCLNLVVMWRSALFALICLVVTKCDAELVPDASAWGKRVEELLARPDLFPYESEEPGRAFGNLNKPLNFSGDTDSLIRKHVPRLLQVSSDEFRLQVAHEMVWPEEEDDLKHVVEFAFVKDVNSGEVLYFAQLLPEDNRVNLAVNLNTTNPKKILTWTWCNLHGLWISDETYVIDSLSWTRTKELLAAQNTVEEECISPVTEKFSVGDFRSLSFQLIDKEGNAVASSDVRPINLDITFRFPTGSFFGVGFGDSMLGTDMVIVAEKDGSFVCADFDSQSRERGPDSDLAIGGKNSIEMLFFDKESDMVTVICRKKIEPDEDEPWDASIKYEGETTFVWAFNDITVDPEENGNFLRQHSINDRGYLVADLSLNEVAGSLSIARARDKRDLQVVHGVLMYAIWGINICIGAMIARYQRHTTWWLGAHKLLQMLSTILTLPVFFLTKQFVETPRRSLHGKLGLFILFSSWFQAALGGMVYLASKKSRAVAKDVPGAKVGREACEILVKVRNMNTDMEFLRILYLEKRRDANASCWSEVDKFVSESLEKVKIPLIPTSVTLYLSVHVRQHFARPIHRVFGRILPSIAYVQMFLGLQKLQANGFINNMIYAWTGLILAILIFKELELQLGMPFGFKGKAVYLFDVGRCKSPRNKRPHVLARDSNDLRFSRDSSDVANAEEANIKPGSMSSFVTNANTTEVVEDDENAGRVENEASLTIA